MLAYLYAVFDLPSLTLIALIAYKCLPKKMHAQLNIPAQTASIVWHYFGLLSLVVITSYLMGVTGVYELGYNYLALVFLLPLMLYSVITANIAVAGLIIMQVGVWLIFNQSYIILWDVLIGELLLLSYIAKLTVKAVKFTIKTVKTL